jgi:hypothetical protein
MDFVSKVVVEYHEGKVREEEEEGFLVLDQLSVEIGGV